MNNIEDLEVFKDISYKLLVEIKEIFLTYYGSNYEVKLTKSEKMYTLCTGNFILMFSIPDLKFFLSFMVYQSGNQIAKDTKLIMLVLDYNEFILLEDSCFDNKTGELVFGTEALEVKQLEFIESAGRAKCPMCDRIVQKEYITDKGICRLCEESKKYIIYH